MGSNIDRHKKMNGDTSDRRCAGHKYEPKYRLPQDDGPRHLKQKVYGP